MKIKCLQCGKMCDFLTVKTQKNYRKIEFCCYEHYLKFWIGTPGFVPLKKSQVKR